TATHAVTTTTTPNFTLIDRSGSSGRGSLAHSLWTTPCPVSARPFSGWPVSGRPASGRAAVTAFPPGSTPRRGPSGSVPAPACHQVRLERAGVLDPGGAVVRDPHAEPLGRQPVGHRPRDRRLVLDDQDACLVPAHGPTLEGRHVRAGCEMWGSCEDQGPIGHVWTGSLRRMWCT